MVEAFPWGTAPTYLIRDNDGSYGQIFKGRLRSMGIRDRPISPRSPWQNAYVERLIGTLRRDCLDHVLIFGERHLRRVLTAYAIYYNETRTHLGLSKDTPYPAPSSDLGQSQPCRSCADCIIVTRGYDFREGQAEAVGVEVYTVISQLEHGYGVIPPDRYAIWAEALGIEPDEFVRQLTLLPQPHDTP